MKTSKIASLILFCSLAMARTVPQLVANDLPKLELKVGAPPTIGELTTLSGMEVWKFNVTLPAGGAKVGLTLQDKNQAVQDFFSCQLEARDEKTNGDFLIAIIPLNDKLNEAEKVRVSVYGFGFVGSSIVANPFLRMNIGRDEKLEVNQDGDFILLGGYQGHVTFPTSAADKVLSLKITKKN